MSESRGKIFLRHDQSADDASLDGKYDNENVSIVAPHWVAEGLRQLSKYIPPGTEFDVYSEAKPDKVKTLRIDGQLTLKDLQMIARNEPRNVSGLIDYSLYEGILAPHQRDVIYSLRDLVRQCVIVARDETMFYGGYPRSAPVPQTEPVYVVDLIALQFQQKCNSGRLVEIGGDRPKGLLDDFIFEMIVGERKASPQEAAQDESGRFVKHQEIFFDTLAYRKFVADDVHLTGLAINALATDDVNLKFLKYGTGFFAGQYRGILNQQINAGVADGLDRLLSDGRQKRIKHVELPHYTFDETIHQICKKHLIECTFSTDDALKKTHRDLVTATTNCADPHAVTGNEMGYSSVDAAIAQNLKSTGNIFSSVLNRSIQQSFVNLNQDRIQ